MAFNVDQMLRDVDTLGMSVTRIDPEEIYVSQHNEKEIKMVKETLNEKYYRLAVTVLAEQYPDQKPLPIDDPDNDPVAGRFHNRVLELAIAEEREACIEAATDYVYQFVTTDTAGTTSIGMYMDQERNKGDRDGI